MAIFFYVMHQKCPYVGRWFKKAQKRTCVVIKCSLNCSIMIPITQLPKSRVKKAKFGSEKYFFFPVKNVLHQFMRPSCKQKSYNGKFCDSEFTQKSDMIKETLKQFMKGRNYNCELCNSTFTLKSLCNSSRRKKNISWTFQLIHYVFFFYFSAGNFRGNET